jgi:hypothetical protein
MFSSRKRGALVRRPLPEAEAVPFIGAGRGRTMKFGLFAFLVFLGGAMFLLSFVADRQAKLQGKCRTQ